MKPASATGSVEGGSSLDRPRPPVQYWSCTARPEKASDLDERHLVLVPGTMNGTRLSSISSSIVPSLEHLLQDSVDRLEVGESFTRIPPYDSPVRNCATTSNGESSWAASPTTIAVSSNTALIYRHGVR